MLDPPEAYYRYVGGSGCVNVDTPSNCCWSAVQTLDSLQIVSGSSGCGDGQVCYVVEWRYNISFYSEYRIKIADQTFRVLQEPVPTPSTTPLGF